MAANSSPPRPFYKIKNKPTRFRNRLYTYKANNYNAEVLAGKSLLFKDLITTNENRNMLNRIFKVNTGKQNHP